MRISRNALFLLTGAVVLAGGFALWSHGERRSSDATFGRSAAYEKVGGKFAASFAQPSETSKPMAVAPGDLPPVDLTAKPVEVR